MPKGVAKAFPWSLEPDLPILFGKVEGRNKSGWTDLAPQSMSPSEHPRGLSLSAHTAAQKGKTLGDFVVGKEEVVLLGPIHELQHGLEYPVETLNQAISLRVIGHGPNKL